MFNTRETKQANALKTRTAPGSNAKGDNDLGTGKVRLLYCPSFLAPSESNALDAHACKCAFGVMKASHHQQKYCVSRTLLPQKADERTTAAAAAVERRPRSNTTAVTAPSGTPAAARLPLSLCLSLSLT